MKSNRGPACARFRHPHRSILALAILSALPGFAGDARAQAIKANNSNVLNLPSSWITAPPDALTTAIFDSNISAPVTTTLGAPLSWLGIQVTSATAPITILADSNSLTLGSSGIDMSAATQALTLANSLVLSAPQTWNVNSTLTASTLDLAGQTLTVQGSGLTVMSGPISGAGGLTKNGAGTLSLTGANSYNFGTTLNAGHINISDAAALGTGTFIVNGGSFDNISAGPISATNGFLLGGSTTYVGSQNLTLTGSAGLSANSTINVNSGLLAIGNILGGTFGITKAGNGSLTISGTNSYSGGFRMTGGTTTFVTASAAGGGTTQMLLGGGTLILAGASSLTITNAMNITGVVTFLTNNVETVAGNATGSGTVTWGLGGRLDLGGGGSVGVPNWSGFSGTLLFGTTSVEIRLQGASGSSTDVQMGGAHVHLGTGANFLHQRNGGNQTIGALSGGPQTQLTTGSAATTFIIGGANLNTTFEGSIRDTNATTTINLTKTGSGMLTLTSTNSNYRGVINISSGTLALGALASFGAATASSAATSLLIGSAANPGTLRYTGDAGTMNRGITIASLATIDASGAGAIGFTSTNAVAVGAAAGTRTLTLTGTNTGLNSFRLPIADGAGVVVSVIKDGPGTWMLTGVNGYSGGTTVNAGTLLANPGSGTAVGSGPITVNGTGGFGGTGNVDASAVFGTGTRLTPGVAGSNNGLGTLAFTGNAGITLNSGTTLDLDFSAAPPINDLITLANGTLTVGGSISVNAFKAGTDNVLVAPGNYNIFTFASAAHFVGSASSFTVINNGTNPATNYSFSLLDNGTSGPSSIVLSVSGVLTGFFWSGAAADGNWGTGGNWTDGVVPGAPGDSVVFGSAAIGAGPVALNAPRFVGALTFDNVSTFTLNPGTGGKLYIDNGTSPASVAVSTGSHVINAPVELNTDATIAFANASNALTINGLVTSGTLNGSTGLTLVGPGKLILTSENAYGGATTIGSGATLQLGNGGTTGTFGAGAVVANGTLAFNRSDALTFGNVFSGSGAIAQTGPGTLTLTGSNFAGTIRANAGLLILSGAGNLPGSLAIAGGTLQLTPGATIGSPSLVMNGGLLDLNGNNAGFSGLTWTAGVIDNVTAGGAVTLTLTLGANTTFGGVIANTSGSVSVTKAGTSTLTLTGLNTMSGVFRVAAGAVRIVNANTLASASELFLNTPTGNGPSLLLPNGMNLATPITLSAGENEFVNVDAAGSATLSGNLISTNGQYRISTSIASASLVLTGTHNAGAQIAILARGNLTWAGNGSLLSTEAAGIRIARQGALTLALSDNAYFSARTIDVGNGQGTAGSLNLTLRDNAHIDLSFGGAAGLFNYQNIGTTSSAVYNLDGGTITTAGFTRSQTAADRTATLNFNGTTIVVIGDPSDFLAAQTNVTNAVKAGGFRIDTNGHNTFISLPFTHDAALVLTLDGGITKSGAGTLFLTGNNSYTGPTTIHQDAVEFSSGTTQSIGKVTGAGTAVVAIGATVTSNGHTEGTLQVDGVAHIRSGIGNNGTSKVQTLVIGHFGSGTDSVFSGSLNIADSKFIVQTTDAADKAAKSADLAAAIVSGRNGGFWNGNGIVSSTVANDPTHNSTVAVFDNADAAINRTTPAWSGPGTYGGQAVDANSLFVTRVILGDGDLSGIVDAADFDIWFRNVGGATVSYSRGDWDQSGIVDAADFDIWFRHVGVSDVPPPATPNWTGGAADGNWATAGNWEGNAVPGVAGDSITFGASAPTAGAVALNGSRRAGTLIFNNANAYALNPGVGGKLFLDNGTAGAQVAVNAGSHAINANVELTSNASFVLASSASVLTIAGIITSGAVNSSTGITVSGPGKLVLAGNNTYGGTTSIGAGSTVQLGQAGAVQSLRKLTGDGSVVVAAGATITSDGHTENSLRVDGVLNIRAGAGNDGTSKINSLLISHTGTGLASVFSGKLNVSDSKLIVQTTNPNDKALKIADLAAAIVSGRNGGNWLGNGLTSSSVANDVTHNSTIALFDNADAAINRTTPAWANPTTFGGQAVNGNSLFVTRALLGDGDLSGIVDAADFDIWFRNVGGTTFSYSRGDWDQSGIVDAADFDIWFRHVGVSDVTPPAAPNWTGGAADGNWATAGNWEGNAVPGVAGDNITFGTGAAAAGTVALNGQRRAGTLVFNNANAYTLSPGVGGKLFLDKGTAGAQVAVNAGSHAIHSDVELTSSASVVLANSANVLTIAGIITSGAVNTTTGITLSGGGKLVLTGNNTYGGTTSIGAGATVQLGQPGAVQSLRKLTGGGSAIVAAGATITSDGHTENSLQVDGVANIRAGAGNDGTSKVNTLTIAHTGTGPASVFSGKLNLADAKLIVQTANPNDKAIKMADLAAAIVSGRSGGTWTGNGITSAANANDATHNSTLGLFDNADAAINRATPAWSNPTTFGGQPVDGSSVLVTRVILGDGDLSGVVDASDFDIWFRNVGSTTFSYSRGDWDQSGIVDASDFDIWFRHVGTSALSMVTEAGVTADQLSAVGVNISHVPEPAGLLLLGLGSTALLARRRRRA